MNRHRPCAVLAAAVLSAAFAATASAKETPRTFTPKKDVDAVEQPESKRVVGTLTAGTAYSLLKVGGPGHNWCKVQLPAGPGWVECQSGGESSGVTPAREGTGPAREAGFAYYVLSLSWSPAYCASHLSDDSEQCQRRGYGFVVHGLWPQNEVGWPKSCGSEAGPDPKLIEEVLPLMPSRKLIAHEWEKHGTCSGLGPADYFAKLRDARDRIHIPSELVEPKQPITKSPDEIERMFLEANPGLSTGMMAVLCKKFVSEIRFCLNKELRFRKCGRDVKNQCKGSPIFPPVR